MENFFFHPVYLMFCMLLLPWIGTSFFKLRKISYVILLKICWPGFLLLLFLLYVDLAFSWYLRFPRCFVPGVFFFSLSFLWPRYPFILSCLQCLKFSLPSLIFCWWGLPLSFLFLNFSFPAPSVLVFFFLLSCLEQVSSFHSTIFKIVKNIHKGYFEILMCASAFLKAYYRRVLDFSGDTLSYLTTMD